MFLDQFIYIAEGWASQFLILKKSGRMSVNSKTITWHSISMCDKYKWHIFYNISFYPVLIKYLFFRDIVLVWDQSNILIVKIKMRHCNKSNEHWWGASPSRNVHALSIHDNMSYVVSHFPHPKKTPTREKGKSNY